jgi:two-component system NtrC family response regulator
MTVLIAGESGTGKEVVARAIHSMSRRSQKGSLIKINCPAVPELLLESELFGHEAGAFTGAVERKPGRLELAVGGTAFLDEIGEMPLVVQAKLLQVLEHKQFTRLGGTDTLSVDVRFVAATNTPLLEQINAKKFRKDLYFRLNQYVIHIPPLRERVEDIPVLVDHFLSKYAPMYSREKLSVSESTMAGLIRYSWPGNVRELESVIQCYALTGREEAIQEKLAGHPGNEAPQLPGTYRQCEKQLILSTLVEVKWNRRRAAEILGMSYNTLRRRFAAYCLDEEEPEFPWSLRGLKIGAGEFP